MFWRLSTGLTIAVLAFGTGGVYAADNRYPERPIRFVVPFPPGGPLDLLARLLGNEMSRSFGQQVVVDNRPGANGIIGTDIVAKSQPDGYTIVMGNVGPIAVNVSLYKKLPYDPLKDLSAVAMVASTSHVLTAHPSLPANSVLDLIRLAKEKPGQLSYGTAGTGSATHLSMELFKSTAGIAGIPHIPYKGVGPAITAVLSGQIPMVMSSIVAVQPFISNGKLKGLAMTDRQRSPALPNVPTMIEAGLPGFESKVWYGVLAPADTPKPIVAKLNGEIGRVLRLQKVVDHLSAVGSDVWLMTPEEFSSHIKAEIVKWRKVIQTANVTLN